MIKDYRRSLDDRHDEEELCNMTLQFMHTLESVTELQDAIVEFHTSFKELFIDDYADVNPEGKRMTLMLSNMHAILHIPDQILNPGPVTCW